MKTHNLSLSLQLSPNECVKRGFSEMKQSFRGKWGCNSATAKRELNKVKPICPPMEMPKPHQKFLHNPWVFFYAKTIQATPTNLPSANSIVCWGRNKKKIQVIWEFFPNPPFWDPLVQLGVYFFHFRTPTSLLLPQGIIPKTFFPRIHAKFVLRC